MALRIWNGFRFFEQPLVELVCHAEDGPCSSPVAAAAIVSAFSWHQKKQKRDSCAQIIAACATRLAAIYRAPDNLSLRPLPRTSGQRTVSDKWSEISSGDGALCETDLMTLGTLIGYARVSTDAQDLTTQREKLSGLGMPQERIYSDRGMAGPIGSGRGSERLWRPACKATPWS